MGQNKTRRSTKGRSVDQQERTSSAFKEAKKDHEAEQREGAGSTEKKDIKEIKE